MKVNIGQHVNWLGPYQIAEKLLFWIPKYDENYKRNKTVWNFGEWLAENKDGTSTYLARLCEWYHSKKKRKIKVRIDNYDVWNLDSTLAFIILPALQRLKEVKSGGPFTDDADVPENLRSTAAKPKENEYDTDEFHFARWEWILDEMIWAFSQINSNWEDQYRIGEIDHVFVDSEDHPGCSKLTHGPNHTYQCDYDGIRKHQDRISNGTRLFGKYYLNLWD